MLKRKVRERERKGGRKRPKDLKFSTLCGKKIFLIDTRKSKMIFFFFFKQYKREKERKRVREMKEKF